MDISLVCCYTKENMAMDMKHSAEKSNIEMEFIFIDNRENRFTSAASALNYGFDKSKGDVVIFLHQDIVFEDPKDLNRMYDYLKEHSDTILGAAVNGMSFDNDFTKAKGLDECIVAVNRKVFDIIRFDEINFDGWHLYCADLCEQANQNGLNVEIMNSSIKHLSNGNIDKAYKITLKKFRKKYRNKTKKIYFSFGWCYTSEIKYKLYNILRIIRYRKINYL